MARRRRQRRHTARYMRENPLSDTELVIGGLLGVTVLGVGGYFLYQYFNPASANAATVAANALPGSSGVPGLSAQQASTMTPAQIAAASQVSGG